MEIYVGKDEFFKVALSNDDVDDVDDEVAKIVQVSAKKVAIQKVDLSGHNLKFVPESFGTIRGLVSLNLSHNHLKVLPDSIGGLKKLEELDVSSNRLESLPDSIGLLSNLKVLKVSSNKLTSLPETIVLCRSLVELYASFNNLMFLPINLGYALVNLKMLAIQLNEIRSLPTSIGGLTSLKYLDAHFNKLHGLPSSIGILTNLEVLNVSSNFSDLKQLPETIGDLTNLKELDLSNNQIRVLPNRFVQLEKLSKLNLDHNPLIFPPVKISRKGIEAVRNYMIKSQNGRVDMEELKREFEGRRKSQNDLVAWGNSMANKFVSKNGGAHRSKRKAIKESHLDRWDTLRRSSSKCSRSMNNFRQRVINYVQRDSNTAKSATGPRLRLTPVSKRAAGEMDFRPSRMVVVAKQVNSFIWEFFDQNPLSQIALVTDGVAKCLTDLDGSPESHIKALTEILGHLKELVLEPAPPPPAIAEFAISNLIKMGFPKRAANGVSKAWVCELPTKCCICGLTLVSSPHLTRSYHHLFPITPFDNVSPAAFLKQSTENCFSCLESVLHSPGNYLKPNNLVLRT